MKGHAVTIMHKTWIYLKSSLQIGNCNFGSSIEKFKVLNQIRNKVHPKQLF